MINSGSIGANSQGNVFVLPDNDGTSGVEIRDSDDAIVHKFDSAGNIHHRGRIQKYQT